MDKRFSPAVKAILRIVYAGTTPEARRRALPSVRFPPGDYLLTIVASTPLDLLETIVEAKTIRLAFPPEVDREPDETYKEVSAKVFEGSGDFLHILIAVNQ